LRFGLFFSQQISDTCVHKTPSAKGAVTMGCDDFTAMIRLGVLFRIARSFWAGNLAETVDRIPIEMHPRTGRSILCCTYKDREALEARCLATLGLDPKEWLSEGRPLADAVRQAVARTTISGPFLSVSEVACSACIRSRYEITNVCRNCVARACRAACPRSAVQIVAGNRAEIDPEKCVSCGKCQQACPYHAIVRITIPCEEACPVDAIGKNDAGVVTIDPDRCIHCGKCMLACPFGAVLEKSEFLDVLRALQGEKPVVALLAPAVMGQFPGGLAELRERLTALGFRDVVEVARGADLVALEEGPEFVARMARGDRLMTTSCCPACMELVKKHVPQLKPFVSHTRSPMRVMAEVVKNACPEAVTVFVGPCVAKRQEALTGGEADFVLTFEELSAMLDAWDGERPAAKPLIPDEAAAREGRRFAVAGGVTQAVQTLIGDQTNVKPVMVDGLNSKAIALLKVYAEKNCPGNFVELMSCQGGCVAGPGTLVSPAAAAKALEALVNSSISLKKDSALGKA